MAGGFVCGARRISGCFFFFQAEDGIRYRNVTGVQTCALPILQRALKRREMLLENRQLNQWLKEEVSTRAAELQRERMKLERLSIATLEALVNALEAKDPYMRGHSARVADLSATIAHELGISEEEVEHVRVAGRLHDIGKIGTRESVLNKQGALTPEEFEHVKQHVVIGSQILAPLV